jgi:hypothetical protein
LKSRRNASGKLTLALGSGQAAPLSAKAIFIFMQCKNSNVRQWQATTGAVISFVPQDDPPYMLSRDGDEQ